MTATLDSSVPTVTLPPWLVPVREHTHSHILVKQSVSENTDNMCVHSLQIEEKKLTHCFPELLYLYQTVGDINLSECHPCFMIPLLMTKPPSTSCLGVITKDTEK